MHQLFVTMQTLWTCFCIWYVIFLKLLFIPHVSWSVRMAKRLALLTLDHGVAGSNRAGGEILPEPKRRFIAQSLPCSPFHRLKMTEILLKGRKTLTHPSIHMYLLSIIYAPVICEHHPTPSKNSRDYDISSITELLKALHFRGKAGSHCHGLYKSYRKSYCPLTLIKAKSWSNIIIYVGHKMHSGELSFL